MQNLLNKIDYKKLVGMKLKYKNECTYEISQAVLKKDGLYISFLSVDKNVDEDTKKELFATSPTKLEKFWDADKVGYPYTFTRFSIIKIKNPLMRVVNSGEFDYTIIDEGDYYESSKSLFSPNAELQTHYRDDETDPFVNLDYITDLDFDLQEIAYPITHIQDLKFPCGEKFLRKTFAEIMDEESKELYKKQFEFWCRKNMDDRMRKFIPKYHNHINLVQRTLKRMQEKSHNITNSFIINSQKIEKLTPKLELDKNDTNSI